MALKFFGDTHDIQTGGVDLVFPHHENAIAISQAATGKPLANVWIHHELVMVQGKKPVEGKEGEPYSVKALIKRGYTGREIRYWLISHHHDKSLYFSTRKLDMVKKTLANLDTFVQKLYLSPVAPSQANIDQAVYDLKHKFTEAMDDNLNIAKALAALFEFTGEINKRMDHGSLSREDRDKVLEALKAVDAVLGVMSLEGPAEDHEIEALIRKREEARRRKDWAGADQIRDELSRRGVALTDTKKGTIWRKSNRSA
jgi:cysteinyl-tRNA synthetase